MSGSGCNKGKKSPGRSRGPEVFWDVVRLAPEQKNKGCGSKR
jgi:hypothetical protein